MRVINAITQLGWTHTGAVVLTIVHIVMPRAYWILEVYGDRMIHRLQTSIKLGERLPRYHQTRNHCDLAV